MKLYLAAGFSRQKEIRGLAYKLRQAGVNIVSSWHDSDENDTDTEHYARYAERDLEELDLATSFAIFNGPTTAGGRHVEFGFVLAINWMQAPGSAKALGYDIHIIGPQLENVFQYMEAMNIQQHHSPSDFLEAITQQHARGG